jgi:hypothetical protein
LQVKPHVVPLHVAALALAGLVHAVQLGPQVRTEFGSEQTPLQRLYPVLHLNPHCLFTQVAMGSALGSVGAGHGEHDVPQVAGELSSAHVSVAGHLWYPVRHV